MEQKDPSYIFQHIIQQQLQIIQLLNPLFHHPISQFNIYEISRLNIIILALVNQNTKPNTIINNKPQNNEYQKIQDLLQREEDKNRLRLKHQLQFREYQKQLIENLNKEKENNRKLTQKYNKAFQQLRIKDIQILHLNNQRKAWLREKAFETDCMISSALHSNFDKNETTTKKNKLHNRRNSQDTVRRNSQKKKMSKCIK